MGLGSLGIVIELYLYYVRNLERRLASVSQADEKFSLEDQTSISGLQKPDGIETSHLRVVRDIFDALHCELRSLIVCMVDMSYKELCNIHLYDVADANILKMDALKNYKVPTAGLPVLLCKFNATTAVVLQLRLPFVPRRLTTILDAEGNLERNEEVLQKRPVDRLVHYKPRNRLCVSEIAINRNRLERSVRPRGRWKESACSVQL